MMSWHFLLVNMKSFKELLITSQQPKKGPALMQSLLVFDTLPLAPDGCNRKWKIGSRMQKQLDVL